MKIAGSDFNIYSIKAKDANNSKVRKSGFATALNETAKDSITISSGKNMSDEEFISALGRKISAEVKAGSSAYDLNDIRQQIALGTYDINVNEIAKKILS